jgi:hypothetical protein
MGYRSSVLCAVGFSSLDKLTEYMTLHKLKDYPSDTRWIIDEFLSKAKIYTTSGEATDVHIAFHMFDDIKWYENFEDIQFMSRFVSGACEFDESAVGRIVRCGEETDDIEHTDYNNDDGEDNIDTLQSLFYPVSLIEIDIPHDKFKKLKTIGEK